MKALLSILLALEFLFSSFSFSFNAHYCGEELKSIAFFGEAEACEHASGHSEMPASCPFHPQPEEEDESKGCCDQKDLIIEGLEFDMLMSSSDWDFDVTDLQHSALPEFNSQLVLSHEILEPEYLNYKPPLIVTDIPIMVQSFLI